MRRLQRLAAIVAGSMLLAIGINFFLVPFEVLDGGIIGMALMVSYLTDMKVGLASVICSIPFFILSWFKHRALFFSSLQGLIISWLLIDLAQPFQYYFIYLVELSPPVSSMIGGGLIGTGFGIMLRYNLSTGGTDLLAHFVSRSSRFNVGFILFGLDVVIVTIGGFLFSAETFLLSVMSISAGGMATGLCTWKPPSQYARYHR
ncbi:YitT family protein [Paenibacillus koleovorans]|uniref:YitT family protein n=1 Tax=Paenibacillus koleovorans TaxID=121608 RepID=UPI000FD87232|nr:YitT family protein [Paenibacillus koleovorans]